MSGSVAADPFLEPPFLEVIAVDPVDAEAAQAGGADRLELVAGPERDGFTPDTDVLRSVLAATDLPVRVMLRDGEGFQPADVAGICRAAERSRDAGASEFVFGFLGPEGLVDARTTREVVGALGADARWTFHRAVDHAAQYRVAWDAAVALGCDTVLTAGGADTVAEGFGELRELAEQQLIDDVTLLVGGGLQPSDVAGLRAAGVFAFHAGRGVRAAGWGSPVASDRVRALRQRLDES